MIEFLYRYYYTIHYTFTGNKQDDNAVVHGYYLFMLWAISFGMMYLFGVWALRTYNGVFDPAVPLIDGSIMTKALVYIIPYLILKYILFGHYEISSVSGRSEKSDYEVTKRSQIFYVGLFLFTTIGLMIIRGLHKEFAS